MVVVDHCKNGLHWIIEEEVLDYPHLFGRLELPLPCSYSKFATLVYDKGNGEKKHVWQKKELSRALLPNHPAQTIPSQSGLDSNRPDQHFSTPPTSFAFRPLRRSTVKSRLLQRLVLAFIRPSHLWQIERNFFRLSRKKKETEDNLSALLSNRLLLKVSIIFFVFLKWCFKMD